MYASTLSPYNSLEMGPRQRCLRRAEGGSRKTWSALCTSSHRAEHQFSFHMARNSLVTFRKKSQETAFIGQEPEPKDHFDLTSKPYPSKEFLEDWLLRTPVNWCGTYQPELLYFDWWIQHESFRPYLMRFLAYY